MDLLFSRECTIFRISNNSYVSPHSHKISYFEELVLNNYSESVKLGEYIWVNTIKFRDKIISTSKKRVNIVYFENKSIVVLFSNSESDVVFVSSQLNNLFNLKLIRKDIFSEIKYTLISKNRDPKIPQLLSLHIRIPLDKDVDKDVMIDTSSIEVNQFENALTSNNLVSLKFFGEGIYFDVDCSSVFSFNDNDSLEEIINVLQEYTIFV